MTLWTCGSKTGFSIAFTERNVLIDLSGHGFNNVTSSYTIGACSSAFYDTTGGTGLYTGNTSAGASANSMVPGWDNRIGSIRINERRSHVGRCCRSTTKTGGNRRRLIDNDPMAAKRGPKQGLTKAHKAALAVGRTEGKVVRDYLTALRDHKPKRGRKRTAESIERRIAAIDEALDEADPIAELKLTQERMDLESELAWIAEPAVDLEAVEDAFVEVAASYSQRSGISYAAWRQVGVAASVLGRAGISRSS